MNTPTITRLLFALLILLLGSQQVWAEASKRSGKWQVTLTPMYTDSLALETTNGSTADLNARTSFGLGFGYNLNENLELGMDMGSGSAGYSGTYTASDGSTGRYRANYYMSYFNFGGTYNLFKSRLTPFISGNMGWTFIDSGIPTGEIGEICWWDPWYWGWVCSPYAKTYTDSKWNYGADLGLRYDITRAVFIKAAIGQTYIAFKNTGTETFTNYKLAIGFMF